MKPVLFLIQIILAILLILVIIIQQKGAGLGSTFGGELSFYRTRRGAEKLLYRFTWFLAVAFIAISVLGLVI
ncbi:MAG: preprotein translocase subunit SecG [Candidatus Daviesbacteria bacterium]|nr:MAG: preprotein translocase subunit SecG [Candidatus Daviesbacteria bacterium]